MNTLPLVISKSEAEPILKWVMAAKPKPVSKPWDANAFADVSLFPTDNGWALAGSDGHRLHVADGIEGLFGSAELAASAYNVASTSTEFILTPTRNMALSAEKVDCILAKEEPPACSCEWVTCDPKNMNVMNVSMDMLDLLYVFPKKTYINLEYLKAVFLDDTTWTVEWRGQRDPIVFIAPSRNLRAAICTLEPMPESKVPAADEREATEHEDATEHEGTDENEEADDYEETGEQEEADYE